MLEGKVFITGGAGTLGRAIIKRATEENWPCDITVYSTDAMKHLKLKRDYPKVKCLVGDVRSYETLKHAITGHDIVIHGAAVKHIPVSEINSIDTFDVNVNGSMNVAEACLQAGVKQCIAISTDKACHPANAYGATKYLMEKVFQEYARTQDLVSFHLVRYGNVLESTGSVIEVWKNQIARGEPIRITDPDMTRFWLSPAQAVEYVLQALGEGSGNIFVAKMKSLDIKTLALYTLGEEVPFELIPLRPGEKIHETLLMEDELRHTYDFVDYFSVLPTVTGDRTDGMEIMPYSSDMAPRLTQEELEELLNG